MSDLTGAIFGASVLLGAPGSRYHMVNANAQVEQNSFWASWMANTLATPPKPPGIHWTKTGGKTWRVEIVRAA